MDLANQIAAGLSPLNPAAAQIQAARILLKNLSQSIAKRETFALESTLSGKTYAKYLAEAKENGFRIVLHFLWLPHPDESWARVQSRVEEGGHAVPKDAVYRRFPRIKDNLLKTYIPLCDNWSLWNASQMPIEFIGKHGTIQLESFLKDD